jgi:hypothetical protein
VQGFGKTRPPSPNIGETEPTTPPGGRRPPSRGSHRHLRVAPSEPVTVTGGGEFLTATNCSFARVSVPAEKAGGGYPTRQSNILGITAFTIALVGRAKHCNQFREHGNRRGL